MKKFLIIVLALYGACYYVGSNYHPHDALAYAKKHPQAKWAPAADYYVGFAYYQRGRYEPAQEAFNQLLMDYPTCQYVPKALVYLSDVQETNHDWEAAKSSLTRYAEDFPNGADISLVTKRLELLKYRHP